MTARDRLASLCDVLKTRAIDAAIAGRMDDSEAWHQALVEARGVLSDFEPRFCPGTIIMPTGANDTDVLPPWGPSFQP